MDEVKGGATADLPAELLLNILEWGTLLGEFAQLHLPPLPTTLVWDDSELYDTGALRVASLVGDHNGDGIVDAADYVMWRKNGGTQTEYDTWRANFGQPSGSGSVAGANGTIPEPATLMLMMFAAAGWCSRRGRAA